jgi:hypothetical protein
MQSQLLVKDHAFSNLIFETIAFNFSPYPVVSQGSVTGEIITGKISSKPASSRNSLI